MAFVDNSHLFPMSFAMYEEFISQNTVVTGTPEAIMIQQVGERLAHAAYQWLSSLGYGHFLDEYRWAFTLIEDDAVNAWVMPGGKIVFYTGILPVTKNEAGIAVVMGHEIAHALLNHGQQRMSAGILQEIGALGLMVGMQAAGVSESAQMGWMAAYGIGTTIGATLPFSRRHENEADYYGLILMTLAGYDPAEAAAFWERMNALGSGASMPQFLSTHPSSANRTRQLRNWIPEAERRAAEIRANF